MKWFLRFLDFYLDASIHVALAIVSLVIATSLLLNIPIVTHLIFFLFFGSISCYNFVKYGPEAEKYMKLTNLYHKNIQFFSILCLLFAAYHAYFIRKETWLGIVVLVFMTGLYAVPILPRSKNLRSLGGLKIFIVSGVWAGTTVILSCLETGVALSWDIYIETAQRFLLVLVLLVPFEVRDLKYDAPELKTVPQRFGVYTTKLFGVGIALLFFLLTFLKDRIGSLEIFGKGILMVLLILLLLVTKKQQSKYFASFWVEGIPVVWVAVLYCIKALH
ncbi:hypothetical protein N9954_02975 [Maribacter sp.]|nr:hypothetical protein [Maribacter sp.]